MTRGAHELDFIHHCDPDFLLKILRELETEAEYLADKNLKPNMTIQEEYDVQGALAFLRRRIAVIQANVLWLEYGAWEFDAEIDYYFLAQMSFTNLQSFRIAGERLDILLAQARALLERWEKIDLPEISRLQTRVLKRLRQITDGGGALRRTVTTVIGTMEKESFEMISQWHGKMPKLNVEKNLQKLKPLSTDALHSTQRLPKKLVDAVYETELKACCKSGIFATNPKHLNK